MNSLKGEKTAVSVVEESVEDENKTGLHESDAALANAPWQYKAIALLTALMLPGKACSVSRRSSFV